MEEAGGLEEGDDDYDDDDDDIVVGGGSLEESRRKRRLLRNLGQETFCSLGPSSVHGVGVIALSAIPIGVNPFKTNGLPNGQSIDLSPTEVATLPPHVQSDIKKFVLQDKKGLYPVPEAGLNSRDISWFLNSAHRFVEVEGVMQCDERPTSNVAFGLRHDGSGYTEMLTTRVVVPGEELVVPYSLENTGRSTATVDGQGVESASRSALPTTSCCRGCMEDLSSSSSSSSSSPEEEEEEEVVVVDIGCACTDSLWHMPCAVRWFTGRLDLHFIHAPRPESAPIDVIVNEWVPRAALSCEVCNRGLSADTVHAILTALPESNHAKLVLKHINEKTNVQLKISKVPETRTVQRTTTRRLRGDNRGDKPGRATRTTTTTQLVTTRERAAYSGLGTQPARYQRRATNDDDDDDDDDAGGAPPTTAQTNNDILESPPPPTAKRPRHDVANPGSWARKPGRFYNEASCKWELGKIREYVSAHERNATTTKRCKEAVCTCPVRSRGMYRYCIPKKEDDYFSDGDQTVTLA